MHGAQGAGCAPVATAFAEGADDVGRFGNRDRQVACNRQPGRRLFALEVARGTGGTIEAAADDEIVDGIRLLASTTGVFTETAGGVTISVLRRLAERGYIGDHETVVAYITGDGLKTIDAVSASLSTVAVPADVEAVDEVLAAAV